MNPWEQENVKLGVLRSKLNKLAMKLGIGHIKVLRLSQKLDKLIVVIQQRLQARERIDK